MLSKDLSKDFCNVWDCRRKPKLHNWPTRDTISVVAFALFSWQMSLTLWTAGSIMLSLRYLTVWVDTKLLHSNYSELSVAIQHLVLSLLLTAGVLSPCIGSCQSIKLLFCLNTSWSRMDGKQECAGPASVPLVPLSTFFEGKWLHSAFFLFFCKVLEGSCFFSLSNTGQSRYPERKFPLESDHQGCPTSPNPQPPASFCVPPFFPMRHLSESWKGGAPCSGQMHLGQPKAQSRRCHPWKSRQG